MSTAKGSNPPEYEYEYSGGLKTELTLALPGGAKRGFAETVDLSLENSSEDESSVVTQSDYSPENQVLGWPPVRSYKKKVMKKGNKFVKVALDGAPYLRKIDLQLHNSYQELLGVFEDMFTFLTIFVNERNMVDSSNGLEYVPTYEDKDGDWMLVGDVPWKMFVESCKRLRLMKSSEAIGLV